MTSWFEVKTEIDNRQSFDDVRREKIRAVEELTDRPLIIYATAFQIRGKVEASGGEVGIDSRDKVGFNEVISTIDGEDLDVLLHSPGGEAEAAESIVALLRSRFSHIRFIVPDQAKSAATMICCAGNEILMDERSELGPIDPQMLIRRADGALIPAPAQAIIAQFDKAKEALSENPQHIPAWLPILQPLGPSLLQECEIADRLSKSLVTDWLEKYMFAKHPEKSRLASEAADYIADSSKHLSHRRRIGLEDLIGLGLNVVDLRNMPELQDAIWGLYHSITLTLDGTAAFKIIENGHGNAYIRQVVVEQITIPIKRQSKPQPNQVSGGQEKQKKKRKRKR